MSEQEGKKVVRKTIANLSKLPPSVISGLSILLSGGKALPAGEDPIVAQKTLPHGHVAAALGIMKEVDFGRLLSIANPRVRQLVIAMVASRLLDPASKLATAASWPSAATVVTAKRVPCRLSADFCVHPMAAPIAIEVFEGNIADP